MSNLSAASGRRVSIGHADIHVEEHGDGEPLLLVAGLGGSGRFWSSQVEEFAREFRVILHDHRGVGRSGPGPIVSNAGELADDLLRVMDALGVERAHLVGHSTGGAIGQHIALREPGRLASLVLSASWAGPTPLFLQTFHTRRDILVNSGSLNYLMVGTLKESETASLLNSDNVVVVRDVLAPAFTRIPAATSAPTSATSASGSVTGVAPASTTVISPSTPPADQSASSCSVPRLISS